MYYLFSWPGQRATVAKSEAIAQLQSIWDYD